MAERGSLTYSIAIPKNQTKLYGAFRSKDFTTYYSYLPLYDNATNTLTLIFNDSEKNSANIQNSVQLLAINNRVSVAVTIDHNGNASKKPVKIPTNDDTILCTGLALQVSDKESVVLGLRDNNMWVGRLILE